MGKPDNWIGSDLKASTEVVQWLRERGGEVIDKSGLAAATMRADLKRGRAMAQLLADMERDGMITREVRGRRTFRITLVDDWDLGSARALEPVPESVIMHPEEDFVVGTISEETDLTSLAETLLALVIRKAAQPTRDQQELVRVRAQLRRCEEASDELIAIRDERDQLRDKVTALENNMRVLQAQLDKPRRGDSGTTIRERLTEQERKMLDPLMRETPATR